MTEASTPNAAAGLLRKESLSERLSNTPFILAVLVVPMAVLTGIGFGLFHAIKGLRWAAATALAALGADVIAIRASLASIDSKLDKLVAKLDDAHPLPHAPVS